MVIYLLGMPSVGKSSTGKLLAQDLKYHFLDLDLEIQNSADMPIHQIFQHHGESFFRELEKKELEKTFNLQNTVVAAGGGTPCFYDGINLMNKNGITFFIDVDLSVLEQRLKNSTRQRPLFDGENNLSEKLQKLYAQRISVYKKAKHLIYDKQDALAQIKIILKTEYGLV